MLWSAAGAFPNSSSIDIHLIKHVKLCINGWLFKCTGLDRKNSCQFLPIVTVRLNELPWQPGRDTDLLTFGVRATSSWKQCLHTSAGHHPRAPCLTSVPVLRSSLALLRRMLPGRTLLEIRQKLLSDACLSKYVPSPSFSYPERRPTL